MSRSQYVSGMDFEYENGVGKVDSTSGFGKIALQHHQPRATPGGESRKSAYKMMGRSEAGLLADDRGAGPYSQFDSPTRNQYTTPGAGRRSPDKAHPAVPAAFNAFWTPRNTRDDIDDSSAGETPKRQDDSEAGTPAHEMAARHLVGHLSPHKSAPVVMTLATSRGVEETQHVNMEWEREKARQSPTKKGNAFTRFVAKCSPGRGSIPRNEVVQHKHSVARGQKHRELSRQRSRKRRYSVSDSGSDAEVDDSELTMPRTSSPRKLSNRIRHNNNEDPPGPSKETPHWLSRLFTFIAQHPTVPHILSFYAQLAFNVFLLAMFSYILWCFWAAIQGDVNKKAFEASADIIAEISACAHDFKINGCESPTRAPALQQVCANWAKCMSRDPMKVARAKVSAQSFAEIFNGFVDALSWKSITVAAAFVLGGLLVSNVAFSKLRHSASVEQPWAHPHAYSHGPPATPQTSRQFSGDGGWYGQGTPWREGPALEPLPSAIEGRGSPVRKLGYH